MSGRSQNGRIHPIQREVDDTTPIIGASLEAPTGLRQQLNETHSHGMNDNTRKDYRN